MDAKVSVGVEVVVSGGHLFGIEELGHLASAEAVGQGRCMGSVCVVWRVCGTWGMVDWGHRFRQRRRLHRLRWCCTEGLLLLEPTGQKDNRGTEKTWKKEGILPWYSLAIYRQGIIEIFYMTYLECPKAFFLNYHHNLYHHCNIRPLLLFRQFLYWVQNTLFSQIKQSSSTCRPSSVSV